MPRIDYKLFIEDNFYIKSKQGELLPFIFNDVQSQYLDTLESAYPTMQGIRENILKGRQFGFSSLITAIFATDFIMSELDEIPIIDSDIYSHKDDATADHITRFNLFLNSFLFKSQGGSALDIQGNQKALQQLRKAFLAVDNGGEAIGRSRGAQYHTQTASAKVSGRGGTKQNIHWSEVAFYPNTEIMNAELLVSGAEEQVPDQYGKIFRETTGNMMGDYFANQYYGAKEKTTDFTSRFIAWYEHKAYQRTTPDNWTLPEYYQQLYNTSTATREQCYWHWVKTKELQDKIKLRENPSYDYEAFLMTGTTLFDSDALIWYQNQIKKPNKEVHYVSAL